MSKKRIFTTGDVAKICGVAQRTVQKWFDKKLIGGYILPGGTDRRIPAVELVRFMEAHAMPVPSELTE